MPGTGLLLSAFVVFVAIRGTFGTPPPLPTNCNHEGQLYPTESVIQEPACGVTGLYCTMFGQVVAMPGVTGCCEYDGQYYEDGDTVTTPDGVVCYCEGGETGEPVPVICPETTVPPPEPTPPQPPPGPPGGCWDNGQFYLPNTEIQAPGCWRPGVYCVDEWGNTFTVDQFGEGCCEYEGQYYNDGETVTRPDGVVCHCVGSETWEAAPMICPEDDFPRDCTYWYNQGHRTSGVYSIQLRGSDDTFSAWCHFDDDGTGAWTVMQRRQDGSVDFYRDWQEYKNGFGDVTGEYWLGNENIYQLTNQAKYKLRIDLQDFDGRMFFAEYSLFRVENEADNYRLRLGNHTGNTRDGMTKLDKDQPFTTKDHGTRQGSHCASVQKAGWWFGEVCLNWANLNGIYKDSGEYTGEQNGIFWFPLRLIGYPELHSLKKVTMKLRRLADAGEVQPSPTPAPEETTVLPPEPTPAPEPTPPQPPGGCWYEGQFYPVGATMRESGCFRSGLECADEWGGTIISDRWGHGCCEYDGQYYEDGETVTRPDGVVCHCVGSETIDAAPMICPEPVPAPEPTPPQPPPGPPGGCWFEGQFYPAGVTMREPGCFRSGVVCADEWGGTLILDQWGYGCCEYEGQYYVDGETLTRPDGVVCYCVGSTVDWEAAPMICPACSVDVVFVVDDSSSITSSMVAKQYMKYFLQCFNQDAWVYVGVILFNCVPRTAIPLGNYTVSDPALPGHIDMLMKEGGLSRIGVAISYTTHTSNFRNGAHRVAVVLTDGYADGNGHESTMDDYAAQADAARDAGISLYSVGIGGQVNSAALQAIGGGPGNVFGTGYPCELANRILQELCGFDTDETPTTTPQPPPPTTTTPIPPGCEYGGQFYPPGTTIEEVPGCMGHVVLCDQNGQILIGDNFGFNCCEYNGQYYEDGETVTMSNGVVCYCEGSETGEAAPMICPEPPTTIPPGCEYQGQFYPPGATIEEVPGCNGHVVYCDQDGQTQFLDFFGYNCESS
ncbi:uncharacterized protein LOC144906813 isoform X2 [Branchiostoma floridae x Branchiostoma belcheri]